MNLKIRVLLMTMVMLLSVFYVADVSASKQNRVFVGCWTQFSAGQCRAIYRDAQGNYFICGKCDSSGNPGGGKCNSISQRTLEQGFWCS